MIGYFKLEVVVVGPVLTKGSEPGEPGLDAVALRAPDGSLVINGKHIHGRCRHAAMEIHELTKQTRISDWAISAFGPEGFDDEAMREKNEAEVNSDWKPVRSRLSFEEQHCSALIGRSSEARDYRLKINEDTQAGEDRMLAVFERAGEHGDRLHFSGLVRVVYASPKELERHRADLLRTLRWLTNIGGEVGVGYGLVQEVSLKSCETPPGVEESRLEGAIPVSISLSLTFEEPFCLAAPQLDENIFRCLDHVPGNALAGAIQRALADVKLGTAADEFPTLQKYFNRIRFRNAFPAGLDSKQRPIPTPASWICNENAGATDPKDKLVLFDAALVKEPALFSLGGKDCIPNFAPDWKGGHGLAAEATGWCEVKKELRTYTEIDRLTGIAKDKRLYAYELARPEKTKWLGAMDIAKVPADERPILLNEFRTLLNKAPLLLGKTDARATISLSSNPQTVAPEPISLDANTDRWIVTLATQALLLDSTALAGASQTQIETAYKVAWSEIGKPFLTLEHYFSQEMLIGSNYLHHRYRNAVPPYYPYLLTGAGSVFVLNSETKNRKAVQNLFIELLTLGIPLNAWAVNKFTRDDKPGCNWRNCPFIPQNGFGEIVVNHPAQLALLHEELGIEDKQIKTVVLP